jgi:hypothetical protein
MRRSVMDSHVVRGLARCMRQKSSQVGALQIQALCDQTNPAIPNTETTTERRIALPYTQRSLLTY